MTFSDIDNFNIRNIRDSLIAKSNSLIPKVEAFCFSTIMKKSRFSSKEKTMLCHAGDLVYPIVVTHMGDIRDAFNWDVEETKLADFDWFGIPCDDAYHINLHHKFLNSGILRENRALIKLPTPVLRPFASDTKLPFFNWYVGFVVDVSNFKEIDVQTDTYNGEL